MSTKRNQALIYKSVPTFLREIRKKAGLTQRQLALKIGQTQWWIARTETGSRRIDIAEFIVFSRGCGLDPAKALTDLAKRVR
jgi:transcriptional regulator with XRE-family HTH domain